MGIERIENSENPQGKYESDDEPFGWNKHIKEASINANGNDLNILLLSSARHSISNGISNSQNPRCLFSVQNVEEGTKAKRKSSNVNRRLNEMPGQNSEFNTQIKMLRLNTKRIENDLEENTQKVLRSDFEDYRVNKTECELEGRKDKTQYPNLDFY
ncbi:hypothetical protein ACOME3_001831 [Neoechinorhynchus agilis]